MTSATPPLDPDDLTTRPPADREEDEALAMALSELVSPGQLEAWIEFMDPLHPSAGMGGHTTVLERRKGASSVAGLDEGPWPDGALFCAFVYSEFVQVAYPERFYGAAEFAAYLFPRLDALQARHPETAADIDLVRAFMRRDVDRAVRGEAPPEPVPVFHQDYFALAFGRDPAPQDSDGPLQLALRDLFSGDPVMVEAFAVLIDGPSVRMGGLAAMLERRSTVWNHPIEDRIYSGLPWPAGMDYAATIEAGTDAAVTCFFDKPTFAAWLLPMLEAWQPLHPYLRRSSDRIRAAFGVAG